MKPAGGRNQRRAPGPPSPAARRQRADKQRPFHERSSDATAAARMRALRARQAAGRACWTIEADVVEVERLLELARLLPAGAEHDHDAVQAALNDLFAALIADE